MKNKLAVLSFLISLIWPVAVLFIQYFNNSLYCNELLTLISMSVAVVSIFTGIVVSIMSIRRSKEENMDGETLSWIALIICSLPLWILLINTLRNVVDCGSWWCFGDIYS